MFWDRDVHAAGGNPKPLGDHDWMVDRATEMFDEIGHGLDTFFEEMKAREAMDLKSRRGKAGGGFCEFLHGFGFPFIFANFNGTRSDVEVFTHEVGHAFQSYRSRDLPMSDIVWPTTEACEIHSMALELLTWPCMDKFYGEEAAETLRRVHLSSFIQFLPYGVSIDHFQHLVYDNPKATPEERNAMWQEIEQTYLPWWNYGDLPAKCSGRLWQQKQHVYLAPFYYIDYCLAMTGALQFWSKSRVDSDEAMRAYVELCRLGGSRDYRGLLESAGLQSPFEVGCLDAVIADAKAFLE
ncbi:MAG: M3 family metallopeptidase [Verrucomicrobiota bacterium]